MDKIYEYANNLNKINDNTYFKKLNTLDIDSFCHSQYDFVYAVDNWSNILLRSALKCNNQYDRYVFIENLYDEHGCGELENSHVNTFNKMIFIMSNSKYEKLHTRKHIKNFIDNINKIIDTENLDFISGMLGMIEYTYITVSKNIYEYLLNKMPNATTHYNLHSTLDVEHAQKLLEIGNGDDIYNGIKYGYMLMDTLYTEMANV